MVREAQRYLRTSKCSALDYLSIISYGVDQKI
ncbi:hypothetical protein RLEG3_00225 (plasmid) [Rhizobium leguminosarum bv. trifolii WSM1689]|nr:hypothetical protein RLEG3_00225 [Rhizobium leguminosarum bv. trifolii WSM1689]